MTRTYWGVVTPDEADGVPEMLFATEEWARAAVAETRAMNPLLGAFVRIVRVEVEFEIIEPGGPRG